MGQPINPAPSGPGNANAGAPPAGNTAPPTNAPVPTPPGGNSTPPAPPQQTPPASGFTQADVDRIVAERLGREKQKFADYDQLKEQAAQWDKFQKESRPEADKALDAAREEGAQKVRAELGGALVEAHIGVAAAGRLNEAQLKSLVAGLDLTRFLAANGSADTEKIRQFIDGIAPSTPIPDQPQTPGGPIPGGFGQGIRAGEVKPSLQSGSAEWDRRNAQGTARPLIY